MAFFHSLLYYWIDIFLIGSEQPIWNWYKASLHPLLLYHDSNSVQLRKEINAPTENPRLPALPHSTPLCGQLGRYWGGGEAEGPRSGNRGRTQAWGPPWGERGWQSGQGDASTRGPAQPRARRCRYSPRPRALPAPRRPAARKRLALRGAGLKSGRPAPPRSAHWGRAESRGGRGWFSASVWAPSFPTKTSALGVGRADLRLLGELISEVTWETDFEGVGVPQSRSLRGLSRAAAGGSECRASLRLGGWAVILGSKIKCTALYSFIQYFIQYWKQRVVGGLQGCSLPL